MRLVSVVGLRLSIQELNPQYPTQREVGRVNVMLYGEELPKQERDQLQTEPGSECSRQLSSKTFPSAAASH